MRILVADDDAVSRRILETHLTRFGHDVTAVGTGGDALRILKQPDAPPLAILDWMMPDVNGPEVCRQLRQMPVPSAVYIILLTARRDREDLIAGLTAGADDYMTKPFDPAELRARVQVGVRVAELQHSLAERVRQLEDALANIRQLQGLLPICCYCKKIRDDSNYWAQVEEYLTRHTAAQFSHAICPDCWKKVVEPQLASMPSKGQPLSS